MPELPEVEAVTRRLQPAAGCRIASFGLYRPQMVHPQTERYVSAEVRGRTIRTVERRGKNILVHLTGGRVIRVHLRMTGNFLILPDARLLPGTVRLWFALEDGRALALDDPRALGRVNVHRAGELGRIFSSLGPEPLSEEFSENHLVLQARRTSKPMKIFLMDQKAVVGLGNIYAAEALFQAGIHPARPARRTSEARIRALYGAIVAVLRSAIDSAITAYAEPGSFQEGEQFPVAVYGREGEPCPACRTKIRRIPQGGRSTYYCPRCQR